jgi:hypothetical protein
LEPEPGVGTTEDRTSASRRDRGVANENFRSRAESLVRTPAYDALLESSLSAGERKCASTSWSGTGASTYSQSDRGVANETFGSRVESLVRTPVVRTLRGDLLGSSLAVAGQESASRPRLETGTGTYSWADVISDGEED